MKTYSESEFHRIALNMEVRCNRWLADGNEFSDRAFGATGAERQRLYDKAATCYAKSQYWLDRFNNFMGLGPMKETPTYSGGVKAGISNARK